MEEEEEERGPGPPPGSGPDHMPSPAWSVLNNLMLRMTPQTPPPASSMQRGLGSAQQLPGRGRLPPEDPAPPPPGSEALLEDSAPPSAELEGPAPQPLEDMPTQSNSNVVAFLSQWADDNLCLIRNISTGMAVAGVMLFARSIKLSSHMGFCW
ncbi:protein C3orf33 homolog isoform X2 [Dromiciops gliroides]|uniref:protein C3orf33 homolog isoform X2 n=1 Tax=Dromiciops gliroides TaxID=33562 RepID=UPI001CC78AD0|nr:protein C3orf33 homolog isoform X2 [Dromiciops gliroides]